MWASCVLSFDNVRDYGGVCWEMQVFEDVENLTGKLVLLTDFGHADHYVGVLKLVAMAICPSVACVDLCHEVPAQNIVSASYLLATAFDYIPMGSVIVVAVDPGAGMERRVLAVAIDGRVVICPDNGVLSLLLARCAVTRAVCLNRDRYFCHPVSATDHGRDIMVPCAAHLLGGVRLVEIGEVIESESILVEHQWRARWVEDRACWRSPVVHVDVFGNVILAARHQPGMRAVHCGDVRLEIKRTFGDVEVGQLVAFVGSFGHVEVACRNGSAANELSIGQGDWLEIT